MVMGVVMDAVVGGLREEYLVRKYDCMVVFFNRGMLKCGILVNLFYL